jgi:hypothetical protein
VPRSEGLRPAYSPAQPRAATISATSEKVPSFFPAAATVIGGGAAEEEEENGVEEEEAAAARYVGVVVAVTASSLLAAVAAVAVEEDEEGVWGAPPPVAPAFFRLERVAWRVVTCCRAEGEGEQERESVEVESFSFLRGWFSRLLHPPHQTVSASLDSVSSPLFRSLFSPGHRRRPRVFESQVEMSKYRLHLTVMSGYVATSATMPAAAPATPSMAALDAIFWR